MNELLKKLLDANFLTEETKQQIEEAVKSDLEALIAETKAATEAEVKTDLAEQWLETRDQLIEAIDLKLVEMVAEEFKELEGDVLSFRDLEVEYAEKLTEAKAGMVESYKADLAGLVENLDSFLDSKLKAEVEELKEDLAIAKQNKIGQAMFEHFADLYKTKFIAESDVSKELEAVKAELSAMTAKLNETTMNKAKLERTVKMESVLSALNGGQRELMETILSGVRTEDLERSYEKYISRVLKESQAPSEKEDKVLAEGKTDVTDKTGVVKTGDTAITESTVSTEEPAKKQLAESEKVRLQRLAGII
jgi:hypothetical protein